MNFSFYFFLICFLVFVILFIFFYFFYFFFFYIFKIAPSKNRFSKLLPQIIKNKFSKDIFKIACVKNIFLNCSLKKDICEISPSRKTFLKLLRHKRSFQNCSSKIQFFKKNNFLKVGILKKHLPRRFNLFFIRIVRIIRRTF